MKNKFLTAGLLLLLAMACSKQEKSEREELTIISNDSDEVINQINFEKLEFDIEDLIGRGEAVISNENIYFVDKLNSQLLMFDAEGNFLQSPITKGEGPSEIQRFEAFTISGDFKYFLSGYTIYEFDQKNELSNRTVLDFYHGSSMKEIESNPQPDDPGIYEVKYSNNEIFVRDGKFYSKIETSNPKLNFLMHEKYYKESANYGEFDIKTGKILRVLGKKPPIYLKYKYIPHFDFYYHDLSDDDTYISFEPDSLIYVADKDFNFKEAFGVSGKGMIQEYIEVNELDDYDDYWKENRARNGFYRQIKFISEDDLLFRTYNTGSKDRSSTEYEENPLRMQIYKSKVLIGDVEIPNYFKVIGKIGEYFYADGSGGNLDNEEIVVYKFKLE